MCISSRQCSCCGEGRSAPPLLPPQPTCPHGQRADGAALSFGALLALCAELLGAWLPPSPHCSLLAPHAAPWRRRKHAHCVHACMKEVARARLRRAARCAAVLSGPPFFYATSVCYAGRRGGWPLSVRVRFAMLQRHTATKASCVWPGRPLFPLPRLQPHCLTSLERFATMAPCTPSPKSGRVCAAISYQHATHPTRWYGGTA